MQNIKRILVANRGEIARRIIRTCRRLDLYTVAIYSEADANAPFVHEADSAVLIGPAQAKKSYLNISAIIDAAVESKVDAIHPGYGFLSENPLFAKRCEERGIKFVGPDSTAIEAMGDKVKARRLMESAGVPVVPGFDGTLENVEAAVQVAEQIEYPIMLKASAGGGGIGLQKVVNEAELRKVFSSTIQKAESFFGDGTVFMEKWIESGRHIEVQIAFDSHGNGVHLFERECSVQRRNQKVVEESPSPFLTQEMREELCQTALRGADSIGYTNLGTMEFLFDEQGKFYFLEMNTRLQVEHPVTEETTQLDLVELQLQIADGIKLPLDQRDIKRKGHAIECRVYAEDPVTHFPSPGNITSLNLPEDLARFDFSIEEGSSVPPFYDPMIGKVIAYGDSREDAISRMEQALGYVVIEGIKTNIPLLNSICKDESFQTGDYDTGLLQQRELQGTLKGAD